MQPKLAIIAIVMAFLLLPKAVHAQTLTYSVKNFTFDNINIYTHDNDSLAFDDDISTCATATSPVPSYKENFFYDPVIPLAYKDNPVTGARIKVSTGASSNRYINLTPLNSENFSLMANVRIQLEDGTNQVKIVSSEFGYSDSVGSSSVTALQTEDWCEVVLEITTYDAQTVGESSGGGSSEVTLADQSLAKLLAFATAITLSGYVIHQFRYRP